MPAASDEVIITIETTQHVAQLQIDPSEADFCLGSGPVTISLSALYSDYVWRTIAPVPLDAQLTISDTNVASVGPGGIVTPLSSGRATLTARLGTNTAQSIVSVDLSRTVGALTTYTQWSTNLPTGQRDPLSTPFNDGIRNIERFVFGLELAPGASERNLPRIVGKTTYDGHDYMLIQYTLGVGVSLTNAIPQYSQDLAQWSNLALGTNASGDQVWHAGRDFTVMMPLDRQSEFFRLELQ
jgi:hypothetical protein